MDVVRTDGLGREFEPGGLVPLGANVAAVGAQVPGIVEGMVPSLSEPLGHDQVKDSPYVGNVAKKPLVAGLVERIQGQRPSRDFSWHVNRFVHGKSEIKEIAVYGRHRLAGSWAFAGGNADGDWLKRQGERLREFRQEIKGHVTILYATDKSAAIIRQNRHGQQRLAFGIHERLWRQPATLDRMFPGYLETFGSQTRSQQLASYGRGGWEEADFIRDQMKAGNVKLSNQDDAVINDVARQARNYAKQDLRENKIPMRSALKELRRQFPTKADTAVTAPTGSATKATPRAEPAVAARGPGLSPAAARITVSGVLTGSVTAIGAATNAWAAKQSYDRGNFTTAALFGVGAGAHLTSAIASFAGRGSGMMTGIALAGSLAGIAGTVTADR